MFELSDCFSVVFGNTHTGRADYRFKTADAFVIRG